MRCGFISASAALQVHQGIYKATPAISAALSFAESRGELYSIKSGELKRRRQPNYLSDGEAKSVKPLPLPESKLILIKAIIKLSNGFNDSFSIPEQVYFFSQQISSGAMRQSEPKFKTYEFVEGTDKYEFTQKSVLEMNKVLREWPYYKEWRDLKQSKDPTNINTIQSMETALVEKLLKTAGVNSMSFTSGDVESVLLNYAFATANNEFLDKASLLKIIEKKGFNGLYNFAMFMTCKMCFTRYRETKMKELND
jgi:hypothetical protein